MVLLRRPSWKTPMSDEILTVKLVTRDGGNYAIRCPHCKQIIGIDGEDLSEICGEQYHHLRCDGWSQISYDARYVKELP